MLSFGNSPRLPFAFLFYTREVSHCSEIGHQVFLIPSLDRWDWDVRSHLISYWRMIPPAVVIGLSQFLWFFLEECNFYDREVVDLPRHEALQGKNQLESSGSSRKCRSSRQPMRYQIPEDGPHALPGEGELEEEVYVYIGIERRGTPLSFLGRRTPRVNSFSGDFPMTNPFMIKCIQRSGSFHKGEGNERRESA